MKNLEPYPPSPGRWAAMRAALLLLMLIVVTLVAIWASKAFGAELPPTPGGAKFVVIIQSNHPPVTSSNAWPVDRNIPQVHPLFVDYHAGDVLLSSTDGASWRVADTNTDGIYVDAAPTNQSQLFRSRGSTNAVRAYSPQP